MHHKNVHSRLVPLKQGAKQLQEWPAGRTVTEKTGGELTGTSPRPGGETEVFMEVSSRRLAIVQHRHLPARGLLSLPSLLGAFLLTGIKRNRNNGLLSFLRPCLEPFDYT